MTKVFLDLKELETVIQDTVHLTLKKLKQENTLKTEPEFISRSEAALMMKVCLSTLDKWSRQGKLKKHFLGKVVRYKKSDVLEALETISKYQRD